MGTCSGCGGRKEPENIPYIVHESEMARMERANKRLWVTVILLIVLFVGSNLCWMHYESQFADVVHEVTQEADNGTNNFVGGDMNGEADSPNN